MPGDKPLLLDRDSSYLELLQYCVEAGINFVIRPNMRSQSPRFYAADGCEVVLSAGLGQVEIYHQLRYKGKVAINLIGAWRCGTSEPQEGVAAKQNGCTLPSTPVRESYFSQASLSLGPQSVLDV